MTYKLLMEHEDDNVEVKRLLGEKENWAHATGYGKLSMERVKEMAKNKMLLDKFSDL